MRVLLVGRLCVPLFIPHQVVSKQASNNLRREFERFTAHDHARTCHVYSLTHSLTRLLDSAARIVQEILGDVVAVPLL